MMSPLWVFSLLAFSVLAQSPVPARAFDNYTLVARTTMPNQLDNGFRVGQVAFWGNPDDGSLGPSSLIAIDLATDTLASFLSSSVQLSPTEKFLKGWAVPGTTDQSIMLINTISTSSVARFRHTAQYRTESITFPNCTDDDESDPTPPVCTGNITQTRQILDSDTTRMGNLSRVGNLPCLGGQVSFRQNRGYFISIGTNFTIYVVDLTNFNVLREITIRDANTSTGFSKRSQMSEDGSVLYILTTTFRFYRINNINTSNPVVELILTFPDRFTPLSFVISDRWEEAIFTTNGNPSFLVYVDLDQKRIFESNPLPGIISPQVILEDETAGFAFVASFARPTLLVRINMQTHETDRSFNLKDQGRATNGWIDPSNATLFIGAQRSSVRVQYPGACPKFCSGHGNCGFAGVCECFVGFSGAACDIISCAEGVDAQTCSGNGICGNNGTCDCFPGYTGPVCQNFTCPSGCNNQGTCDVVNHICTCNPGWSGLDCSDNMLAECGKATRCETCARKTTCVWCEVTETCILGDINGPFLEYCSRWQHRNCNFIAFRVVGYLFVAIIFLFILINFLCTVKEDRMGVGALIEKRNLIRSLWVAQRDQQTWQMIEQTQIAALTAYVATALPSNYKTFTDALSILLVSARPAWQEAHLPLLPNRKPQSFLQTGITIGTHPVDLMTGSFFIFILLVAFNIIVGIIAFFSKNELAKWRSTNLFFRICQFCQPGLVSLGAYTVCQLGQEFDGAYISGFSFAAAFLSIIFLGFAYPIFGLIFIKLKLKDLYTPSYRVQFGSFYDVYHHDKFWFGPVNLLKVTFISLFVGFFADETSGWHSPIMSMLMPIFIIAIFIILTCVARPYIDKIRGIVQTVMLGIFNIFVFGLVIVYLRFEPYDGWGIAVAAFVGGGIMMCILMYIMNHIRIARPHTTGEDNSYVRM